jgi:hypothetical protein
MVELIGAELHGVRFATQMLGMTRATLQRRAAVESSMKAALRSDVSRHVLVTGEAELRLTGAITTVVAGGALFFILGVR